MRRAAEKKELKRPVPLVSGGLSAGLVKKNLIPTMIKIKPPARRIRVFSLVRKLEMNEIPRPAMAQ